MSKEQEYLQDVLDAQSLDRNSEELQSLRTEQSKVEEILRTEFEGSNPTIRLGGSIVKGTMIREKYDLDIVCYFPPDESDAGDSLQEIYESVERALSPSYLIDRKRSALRLHSSEHVDFNIDVVPGRFVDESEGDCYLHQSEGEKRWLKTNLDKHIAFIKGSGVVPAIRILKLWRTRRLIPVKQFAFELLVIKVLADQKSEELPAQLLHFWEAIEAQQSPISVEDPANPEGNDCQATPSLTS